MSKSRTSNLTKFSIIVRPNDTSSLILAKKGEIPFHITINSAGFNKCWAVVDEFNSELNIPCTSYDGKKSLWAEHKLWEKYSVIVDLVTDDEKEAEAPVWLLINEVTGEFCRCNDREGKQRIKGMSDSVKGKASPPDEPAKTEKTKKKEKTEHVYTTGEEELADIGF